MPAVPPERDQIERLVRGEHHEPHRLLGAHLDGDQVTIRAWRPDATGVVALVGDERVTLDRIHPAGLFEGVLARGDLPAYRLEVTYGAGPSPSTIRTASGPPSGSWTSTCSARAATSGCGSG